MVDIFSEVANKPQGKFFKFVNKGDAIQGTLIETYQSVNSFKNNQTVYVLKNDTGVHNVAFTNGSITIMQMEGVKLGQIVGFRLDDIRPSKRNPGSMAKIIKAYHDPKLVDATWSDGRVTNSLPADASPAAKAEEMFKAVRSLAISKGIAPAGTTNGEIDAAIEEFIGAPLLEESDVPNAIMKLSLAPDKREEF